MTSLSDLPPNALLLVCGAVDQVGARQDVAVDRATRDAVRHHRSTTVRRLRVDPLRGDQQFQAFPNLTHLYWRSDGDGAQSALLRHLADSPLPAVFARVTTLELIGRTYRLPGLPPRLLPALPDAFPCLRELRVDHRVDRADLEALGRCGGLRRLELWSATAGALAHPTALPPTLTCLRVLDTLGNSLYSPLGCGESLLELDMPQYIAFVYVANDLRRLAQLQKVTLLSVNVLTPVDLPVLSWTHLTLSASDALPVLLPCMPRLQRVDFGGSLVLPTGADDEGRLVRALTALRGKYDAPGTVRCRFGRSMNSLLTTTMLEAILENAADRPDALALVGINVDAAVLGVLHRRAPQLRHLTLLGCGGDPLVAARSCDLVSVSADAPQLPPSLVWRKPEEQRTKRVSVTFREPADPSNAWPEVPTTQKARARGLAGLTAALRSGRPDTLVLESAYLGDADVLRWLHSDAARQLRHLTLRGCAGDALAAAGACAHLETLSVEAPQLPAELRRPPRGQVPQRVAVTLLSDRARHYPAPAPVATVSSGEPLPVSGHPHPLKPSAVAVV
jgi:hypothetical protein